MTIRSLALFAHIVGMLVLFVGLALEWLSLESLRRSTSPMAAAPWAALLRALPRYVGGGAAVIVLSGIYLATRVGVLDQAWVRVSFGAMVFMAIFGGPVIRTQMRTLLHAADDRAATPSILRRLASHPLLRASLRTRTAVALAIVYLMIGKPDLGASLILIGLAAVFGAVASVPQWRAQLPALDS